MPQPSPVKQRLEERDGKERSPAEIQASLDRKTAEAEERRAAVIAYRQSKAAEVDARAEAAAARRAEAASASDFTAAALAARLEAAASRRDTALFEKVEAASDHARNVEAAVARKARNDAAAATLRHVALQERLEAAAERRGAAGARALSSPEPEVQRLPGSWAHSQHGAPSLLGTPSAHSTAARLAPHRSLWSDSEDEELPGGSVASPTAVGSTRASTAGSTRAVSAQAAAARVAQLDAVAVSSPGPLLPARAQPAARPTTAVGTSSPTLSEAAERRAQMLQDRAAAARAHNELVAARASAVRARRGDAAAALQAWWREQQQQQQQQQEQEQPEQEPGAKLAGGSPAEPGTASPPRAAIQASARSAMVRMHQSPMLDSAAPAGSAELPPLSLGGASLEQPQSSPTQRVQAMTKAAKLLRAPGMAKASSVVDRVMSGSYVPGAPDGDPAAATPQQLQDTVQVASATEGAAASPDAPYGSFELAASVIQERAALAAVLHFTKVVRAVYSLLKPVLLPNVQPGGAASPMPGASPMPAAAAAVAAAAGIDSHTYERGMSTGLAADAGLRPAVARSPRSIFAGAMVAWFPETVFQSGERPSEDTPQGELYHQAHVVLATADALVDAVAALRLARDSADGQQAGSIADDLLGDAVPAMCAATALTESEAAALPKPVVRAVAAALMFNAVWCAYMDTFMAWKHGDGARIAQALSAPYRDALWQFARYAHLVRTAQALQANPDAAGRAEAGAAPAPAAPAVSPRSASHAIRPAKSAAEAEGALQLLHGVQSSLAQMGAQVAKLLGKRRAAAWEKEQRSEVHAELKKEAGADVAALIMEPDSAAARAPSAPKPASSAAPAMRRGFLNAAGSDSKTPTSSPETSPVRAGATASTGMPQDEAVPGAAVRGPRLGALKSLMQNAALAHELMLNPDFQLPVPGMPAQLSQERLADLSTWGDDPRVPVPEPGVPPELQQLMQRAQAAQEQGEGEQPLTAEEMEVMARGMQAGLNSEVVRGLGRTPEQLARTGWQDWRAQPETQRQREPQYWREVLGAAVLTGGEAGAADIAGSVEAAAQSIAELVPHRADWIARFRERLGVEVLPQLLAAGGATDAQWLGIGQHVCAAVQELEAPARQPETTAWAAAWRERAEQECLVVEEAAAAAAAATHDDGEGQADEPGAAPRPLLSAAWLDALPRLWAWLYWKLEIVRVDTANFHLHMLAPSLSTGGQGAEYEADRFATAVQEGSARTLGTAAAVKAGISSVIAFAESRQAQLLRAAGRDSLVESGRDARLAQLRSVLQVQDKMTRFALWCAMLEPLLMAPIPAAQIMEAASQSDSGEAWLQARPQQPPHDTEAEEPAPAPARIAIAFPEVLHLDAGRITRVQDYLQRCTAIAAVSQLLVAAVSRAARAPAWAAVARMQGQMAAWLQDDELRMADILAGVPSLLDDLLDGQQLDDSIVRGCVRVVEAALSFTHPVYKLLHGKIVRTTLGAIARAVLAGLPPSAEVRNGAQNPLWQGMVQLCPASDAENGAVPAVELPAWHESAEKLAQVLRHAEAVHGARLQALVHAELGGAASPASPSSRSQAVSRSEPAAHASGNSDGSDRTDDDRNDDDEL